MAERISDDYRGSVEVRDLVGDRLELHFVPPIEQFDLPHSLAELIGHATMMEEDPSRVTSAIVDKASSPRWGEEVMELLLEGAFEVDRSVVDLRRATLQARATDAIARSQISNS